MNAFSSHNWIERILDNFPTLNSIPYMLEWIRLDGSAYFQVKVYLNQWNVEGTNWKGFKCLVNIPFLAKQAGESGVNAGTNFNVGFIFK